MLSSSHQSELLRTEKPADIGKKKKKKVKLFSCETVKIVIFYSCCALLRGIVLTSIDALNLAGNIMMEATARSHQLLLTSEITWASFLCELNALFTSRTSLEQSSWRTALSLSVTSQRHEVRGLGLRASFLSLLQISNCLEVGTECADAHSCTMWLSIVYGWALPFDWSDCEYTANKELK